MDLKPGIFVVPDATNAASTVAQILEAERSGLDIVGVQDHPYQWRFFDTWTLLAYVAGRTERVRLLPDALNLPLRLPAMIAKSVASPDSLSGGRVELGIGAGAFWDAVTAMGGPRRTPKGSVDAHYLHPEEASKGHAAIDEAARAAGRDPTEIERALNVMALEGQPATWADQLAHISEAPALLHAAGRRSAGRSCHLRTAPRRRHRTAPARADRLAPQGHHHNRRQMRWQRTDDGAPRGAPPVVGWVERTRASCGGAASRRPADQPARRGVSRRDGPGWWCDRQSATGD